jgi:hypothetical protein
MQIFLYLSLGFLWGTFTWLAGFKVYRMIELFLGANASDWWRSLSYDLLPSLVAALAFSCLALVPLLFKGYIEDWCYFLKIWQIPFWLGGAVVARMIRARFMS